jgi:hypothetical protein
MSKNSPRLPLPLAHNQAKSNGHMQVDADKRGGVLDACTCFYATAEICMSWGKKEYEVACKECKIIQGRTKRSDAWSFKMINICLDGSRAKQPI